MVAARFEKISFSHVQREINIEANGLSKEALQVEVGSILLEESVYGIVSTFVSFV